MVNIGRCLIVSELSQYSSGSENIANISLSYAVAVIQPITSCHKKSMTTCVITLWRIHLMPLTTSVSTIGFLTVIMFILKAEKSHFEGSCDKQPRDHFI